MIEKIIQSYFVSEEYFLYVKLENNDNSSDFCINSMCGKILHYGVHLETADLPESWHELIYSRYV